MPERAGRLLLLAPFVVAVAAGSACDATALGERRDASELVDTRDERDAGASELADVGLGAADDASVLDDTGLELDAAAELPLRACSYPSTSFTGAPLELDVGPAAPDRLSFVVRDLPDPALVVSATLSFLSHDADHPGEEGVIRVNGSAPIDLPAMLAWDNADATSSVDVTGMTVLGDNRIEFGPGPLARSFFRISQVRLELQARVADCAPVMPPPDPTAVERRMHFDEASYTNRGTWVVPCAPGEPGFAAIRDYAFTASGAEHVGTDCDGLYVPGGSRRGTATFTFPDVIPSTYGVYVRYRSSANRNPRGALFVVNGEEMRIDQVDASGEYFEVLFGDRRLGGTVTVVLDSSREAESDSVTWIRLAPR